MDNNRRRKRRRGGGRRRGRGRGWRRMIETVQFLDIWKERKERNEKKIILYDTHSKNK